MLHCLFSHVIGNDVSSGVRETNANQHISSLISPNSLKALNACKGSNNHNYVIVFAKWAHFQSLNSQACGSTIMAFQPSAIGGKRCDTDESVLHLKVEVPTFTKCFF